MPRLTTKKNNRKSQEKGRKEESTTSKVFREEKQLWRELKRITRRDRNKMRMNSM